MDTGKDAAIFSSISITKYHAIAIGKYWTDGANGSIHIFYAWNTFRQLQRLYSFPILSPEEQPVFCLSNEPKNRNQHISLCPL